MKYPWKRATDTITFEVDRFPTFALCYTDEEIIGAAEPTIKSVNYTAAADSMNIEAAFDMADIYGGKVTAAIYDSSDNLIQAKVYDAAATVNMLLSNTEGAYITVYWWNDFETITPVCDSVTIMIQ